MSTVPTLALTPSVREVPTTPLLPLPLHSTERALLLETELGTLRIRLHADAAPQAVQRIIDLAERPLFGSTTADSRSSGKTYFEYQNFEHIKPHRELRLSWFDHPTFLTAEELSSAPLGLDDKTIESHGEAMNLLQDRLFPLWKRLGSAAPRQLEAWSKELRATRDASFLVGVTWREVLEAEGHTFTEGLASRPVRRGSVVLVPHSQGSARLQLRIVLIDQPQLTGRQVVVGSLDESSIAVATDIASQPRLSRLTQRKSDLYRPIDPVQVLSSAITD